MSQTPRGMNGDTFSEETVHPNEVISVVPVVSTEFTVTVAFELEKMDISEYPLIPDETPWFKYKRRPEVVPLMPAGPVTPVGPV